jgi:tryptophanyl-tRNA synthetase
MHLGNYFGAVQNWVRLQENYNCSFGVATYHSMSMPYKADTLRKNTRDMIMYLIACGVKPTSLFVQSMVPEHTELAWILSCVLPFGDLSRMTQFKDKRDQLQSQDSKAAVTTGLFSYPVLQAADILIYRADYVPVGVDQSQHLQLTRDIAYRFNQQFGKDYFRMPELMLTDFPKIMSPVDPARKMSKSLGEKHYISLFSDETRIRKQIKTAMTDSQEKTMGAGVANLFVLLQACGAKEAHDSLMCSYTNGTLKYTELKEAVIVALNELCGGMRQRYAEAVADETNLMEQVKASSEQKRAVARQTLNEVRDLVGLF